MLKNYLCIVLGMIGSFVANIFGGWDAALTTLVIFMAIDYITGVVVAGIFHNSQKSETGSLKSLVGWQGICRKGVMLGIVIIAHRLDLLMGVMYVKDLVVIAYCVNELISIMENVGLMGVPMPDVIKRAIDVLKERGDVNEDM